MLVDGVMGGGVRLGDPTESWNYTNYMQVYVLIHLIVAWRIYTGNT